MIDHYFKYFLKLTPQAWIDLSLLVLTALLFLLVRRYWPHFKSKSLVYFVLLVAFTRLLLFYNPFTWALYNKLLSVNEMDWRQYDELVYEGNKFISDDTDIKYYAVGASATGVTYKQYAKEHPDLKFFSMAGLSPLDMYTFRYEIIRHKPKVILLNLSELDMARKTELSSSQWSPFSLKDIREFEKVVDTVKYFTDDDRTVSQAIIFGKYFPEFKYSFIYKSLLEKIFREKEANVFANAGDNSVDTVQFRIHMREIGRLSREYIPFNAYYLAKSVKFFNGKKIPVIVVEGQYNPRAYCNKTKTLNQEVRNVINTTIKSDPMNRFIHREQLYQFADTEYRDGYHVKSLAGLRFTTDLVKYLESSKFLVVGN